VILSYCGAKGVRPGAGDAPGAPDAPAGT